MFKLGKPLASTRKVKMVSSALCNCARINKPTKEGKKKKKEEISNQFVFQSQKWIYIWSNYEGEKKKKLIVCASKDKEN